MVIEEIVEVFLELIFVVVGIVLLVEDEVFVCVFVVWVLWIKGLIVLEVGFVDEVLKIF